MCTSYWWDDIVLHYVLWDFMMPSHLQSAWVRARHLEYWIYEWNLPQDCSQQLFCQLHSPISKTPLAEHHYLITLCLQVTQGHKEQKSAVFTNLVLSCKASKKKQLTLLAEGKPIRHWHFPLTFEQFSSQGQNSRHCFVGHILKQETSHDFAVDLALFSGLTHHWADSYNLLLQGICSFMIF